MLPLVDQPSKFRVLEFSPQLFSDALPVTFQSIACNVVTDVLYIACEQREGVGIKARINGLGEIDDSDLPLPVEYVIG